MTALDWLDLIFTVVVAGAASGALAIGLVIGVAGALRAARDRRKRSNHP